MIELNSRQLSTLTEMGIPVWELRQHKNLVTDIPENEIFSEELKQQLLACNWFILIDPASQNEQTQCLLQAILVATKQLIEQIVIIHPNHLALLKTMTLGNKVVLALGEEVTENIFGKQLPIAQCRGQIHQMIETEFATIISYGLDELVRSPNKKAEFWQDLQLTISAVTK